MEDFTYQDRAGASEFSGYETGHIPNIGLFLSWSGGVRMVTGEVVFPDHGLECALPAHVVHCGFARSVAMARPLQSTTSGYGCFNICRS